MCLTSPNVHNSTRFAAHYADRMCSVSTWSQLFVLFSILRFDSTFNYSSSCYALVNCIAILIRDLNVVISLRVRVHQSRAAAYAFGVRRRKRTRFVAWNWMTWIDTTIESPARQSNRRATWTCVREGHEARVLPSRVRRAMYRLRSTMLGLWIHKSRRKRLGKIGSPIFALYSNLLKAE